MVFVYGLCTTAGPTLPPAAAVDAPPPEPGMTTLALPALGAAGREAALLAGRLDDEAELPPSPGITMGSLLPGPD